MAQETGTDIKLPAGYRLIALDSVDSTNEEARRRLSLGHGTWIVAAEQSEGRGRRGRKWISERGNLYASLILCPDVPLAEAAELSFVTALAVHDALAALLPPAANLHCKWPNDILLDGKKLAGLLLESASGGKDGVRGDKTGWVIIGIGVNVAHFPEGVEFPATSLKAAGFSAIGVGSLFQAIAAFMADWLDKWHTQGFPAIREAWKARAAGLGQPILVRLENETLSGLFQDIGPGGELLLALDRGEVKPVSAGDVFFAPPRGHSQEVS
jgi:BirA family biotin operon repressor/biotin-[acetyl-CoA-carboxylase] ligase